MRGSLIKFFVALMLLVTSISMAADVVIVPGNPPITMNAAHCHMRLIEFVLGTRLTVAQKDTFLKAIARECSQMPEQDKINFLSACELVDSMKTMESAGHEAVKFVLKKDFEDTAKGLPGDPAAVLFLELEKENSSTAIQIGENIITKQSLAALIEYLEFVAEPYNPEPLSESAVASVKKILEKSFLKLSEDEQATLDDFQLTWYMLRAAWQGTTDEVKLEKWAKSFISVGIKPTQAPDFTQLKACLSSTLYADLLDEAAKLGAEPSEWSVGNNLNVW